MNNEIIKAVEELNEEKVLRLVKKELEDGINGLEILTLLQEGMERVGNHYENSEYFIADLIMAGIIFREVLELEEMNNNKVKSLTKPLGVILIGTVKGDLHDIGKDIFCGLAQAAGFEIHDLGVDVPVDTFIEQIEEVQPDIVGMSGVLTLAIGSMKEVVDKIEEEGLRDKIKIIIGGNPLSEDACKFIGADSITRNASEGVEICKDWMTKGRIMEV